MRAVHKDERRSPAPDNPVSGKKPKKKPTERHLRDRLRAETESLWRFSGDSRSGGPIGGLMGSFIAWQQKRVDAAQAALDAYLELKAVKNA